MVWAYNIPRFSYIASLSPRAAANYSDYLLVFTVYIAWWGFSKLCCVYCAVCAPSRSVSAMWPRAEDTQMLRDV